MINLYTIQYYLWTAWMPNIILNIFQEVQPNSLSFSIFVLFLKITILYYVFMPGIISAGNSTFLKNGYFDYIKKIQLNPLLVELYIYSTSLKFTITYTETTDWLSLIEVEMSSQREHLGPALWGKMGQVGTGRIM